MEAQTPIVEDTSSPIAAPKPNGEYVEELVQKAKAAAGRLASLSTTTKNQALLAMADGLIAQLEDILAANEKDLDAFGSSKDKQAMADRLRLTPERITAMADGIREVAALTDPVGQTLSMQRRPNGMQVGRVRVPIGVIGIIYESRPNVTADSAALCLKSGNVCVLRGGSEAIHSNTAIAAVLSEAAEKAGVPSGAIIFLDRTDRDIVSELLKQDQYVDLIIPRGGESLMKTVTDADVSMAKQIALNAKVQRPSTCNAMETLLIHHIIARAVLPDLVNEFMAAGVEVRGCSKTLSLCPAVKPAADSDYGQEFLSLILAVKIVRSMEEAMEHIARHGSRHTEAIVTKDYGRALRFLREVDAGAVLVNASTRLNDGNQFGLGAEIGISTTRIHARGPMGLEELTCPKFVVFGSGQIRT
jgi:glutamate-5-semialdehyde dehydrogenase